MRKEKSHFLRGINHRFDITTQDDPERLYRLQNARLQSRGETGQVSRINGFQELTNSPDFTGNVLDTITFSNNIVTLWHDGSDVQIEITNLDEEGDHNFSFEGEDLGFGKLLLLEDTIFIAPYNKQLNLIEDVWYLNDFKSLIPGILNVFEPAVEGNLSVGDRYWYTIRSVFLDGHKTRTAFPKFFTIGDNRSARLLIPLFEDLDGELVQIEIYRRKEGEQFFLIDIVDIEDNAFGFFHYDDLGKSNIKPLNERNYIWNETEKTAEIVRDRLVRANLTYNDRNIDISATVLERDTTDNYTLIPNIEKSIYGRILFPDGIKSPHKLLGTIEVEEDGKSIRLEDISTTASNESIGFYLSFDRPTIRREESTQFPTLEIYNVNVPSILTSDDPVAEQDRPLTPRVFVGFKQIQLQRSSSTSSIVDVRIRDEDYSGAATDFFIVDTVDMGDDDVDIVFPNYFETEVIEGVPLLYKKIARDPTSNALRALYEIAWAEGLKGYITEKEFKINLDSVEDNVKLSNRRSISSFRSEDVTVVSYEDLVDTQEFEFVVTPAGVFNAELNRFYIDLSSDSIFNDYNFETFNNQDIESDWDSVDPDLSNRATFNFLNFDYIPDDSPSSQQLSRDGNDYVLYTYDDHVIEPVPDIDLGNSGIFLGNTTGQTSLDLMSGLERIESNGFTYWTIPEFAILETLVTSDDLETFQRDFPNQLIWSEPYVIGSGISGIRDFTFTNFKNISQDYGDILDIRYINNVLLVFCERGVNLINVGEVLTQQPSGITAVDSTQFLTGDRWILKNVPNIQRKSIKQYEDILFFSDGRDIWTFDGQLRNITNGKIVISGIASPFCVSCASIDPKNKEYRVSDINETWVYGMELDEWMGPFSYQDITSTTYRDRMFSVIGDRLVEHNIGNTFNGESYESIIESIATPQEAKSIDKLYRKFYIETSQEGQFSYSKNYEDWIDKNLSEVSRKGEFYNIGIGKEHKNSKRIFWKVQTNEEDFVLRSIDFEWEPRNRR